MLYSASTTTVPRYYNYTTSHYFEGRREREIRQALVAERGGKCQAAGCNFPPTDLAAELEKNKERAPLEFHHVKHGKNVEGPDKKAFEINEKGMTHRTNEEIKTEAAKTVLLCPTHHALVHRAPETGKNVKFDRRA
jgi:hypothetical protein